MATLVGAAATDGGAAPLVGGPQRPLAQPGGDARSDDQGLVIDVRRVLEQMASMG